MLPAQPIAALQQYDLHDEPAQALIAGCKPLASETVLEVGPGLGALTQRILACGSTVFALERDAQRATGLRQRFARELASGQLQILVGDALHLAPELPAHWRVIANPPFQLTSALLRRWLLEDLPGGAPARMDLILQKQAAFKLCGAGRGEQTRMSVLLRLFGVPKVVAKLPRTATVPPSHVDLGVFACRRHRTPPSPQQLRLVDQLLERAFAGAHRMREALKGLATPTQMRRQAEEQQWDIEAHPRTLLPQAWLALAQFLHAQGKL